MSGDPRHSSGAAGVGAAAPWAAVPAPSAEPAHTAAPPAAPAAHPPGMPDAPSQGGSQSTPVYLSRSALPRPRRRKADGAALVTASLKVPQERAAAVRIGLCGRDELGGKSGLCACHGEI